MTSVFLTIIMLGGCSDGTAQEVTYPLQGVWTMVAGNAAPSDADISKSCFREPVVTLNSGVSLLKKVTNEKAFYEGGPLFAVASRFECTIEGDIEHCREMEKDSGGNATEISQSDARFYLEGPDKYRYCILTEAGGESNCSDYYRCPTTMVERVINFKEELFRE